MGQGADQPSRESVVMSMEVDESWLRRHASFSHPNNLGILTGIGDSMFPTFEDGDPLLVDRSVNDVKLDAVYVLSLNDRLYIKRLQQRPDGAFVMISDNKAYDSYVIADAEREKLRVLGRVVMVWNARKI
jgi:phage repressor protein C with HTH and peptisase S24 domain